MKLKNQLGVFAFFIIISNAIFGQCNVGSDLLDDGSKYYMHAKEELYVNDDFEHGIKIAYVQLIVIQAAEDKDLLQFVMFVDVGRSGSKKMVIPRKVKLYFTDGSSFEILAESLESPRMQASVYMQQGTFRLNLEKYTTIQKKSISKVVIIDHRENIEMVCNPYKDLLKEQANCIALKLK